MTLYWESFILQIHKSRNNYCMFFSTSILCTKCLFFKDFRIRNALLYTACRHWQWMMFETVATIVLHFRPWRNCHGGKQKKRLVEGQRELTRGGCWCIWICPRCGGRTVAYGQNCIPQSRLLMRQDLVAFLFGYSERGGFPSFASVLMSAADTVVGITPCCRQESNSHHQVEKIISFPSPLLTRRCGADLMDTAAPTCGPFQRQCNQYC